MKWLLVLLLSAPSFAQTNTPPSYFESTFLSRIKALYQTATFTPTIPCTVNQPCNVWYNGIAPVTFIHQYGSVLPKGCAVGQTYYKTGSAAGLYVGTGGNPYVCSWLPIGGGGGGSGTVTAVGTDDPLTGGPITTLGTIGCPTCVISAAALTANRLLIGADLQGSAALGSLGTVNLTLHGNASGPPSFGAVALATDISGVLSMANGGNGADFSGIAKGGLLAGASAGTLTLKTVGTDGQVLTADSGSTGGLKWATPASPGTGTVTSLATTSPLSGGTVTTTGTLSCPTCTTNASALSADQLVVGAGSQAAAVLANGSQLQFLRMKPNVAATKPEWATLPYAYAADYDFPTQSPSGTLTAATPATVTLAPVPLGVNGTDAGHYLYLPTCTGGAQAVLITGGSATSGSASGTVTFTPANSCTAGWTIQSATGGIQEATQSLSATGGKVWMASATIHGTIALPAANYTLDGLSKETTIITRGSDLPNGDVFYPYPDSAYYTTIQNFSIHNGTVAAQTSGAAIEARLNRTTVLNSVCTGGYICWLLDGSPGFYGANFEMHSDAHSNSQIKLTAANSASNPTDVSIGPGQIYANTGVGVRIGGADGVNFLGIQGGAGSPGWLIAPEAGPAYVSNVLIDGMTWDANGNNGYPVIGMGAGSSSAGNIQISNSKFLSGSSFGIATTGAVEPLAISGNVFSYPDQIAIAQNGAASLPMLVSGNVFIGANVSTTANTPTIQINGGNANITGNAFYSDTATWQIGSESTTSHLTVTGNVFQGISPPISTDMGGGTFPASLLVQSNEGLDTAIGSVASSGTLALPFNPEFLITGTTGVTAITDGTCWAGRSGSFRTTSGTVTFTAGTTIGNTLTTTTNVPTFFTCDGTHLWLR